jgi:predicted DNA-binding transcriptional regulator AlpA
LEVKDFMQNLEDSATTTAVRRRPRRNPPSNRPVTVTVNDACAMLGIGRSLAYLLIAKRKLRTALIGSRRVVFVDSIEALAEENAASTT